MYYELLFPELKGCTGEQRVCCPYPHQKADGSTYYDHNPSFTVNLDKGVHKCLSCGRSGNEAKLLADIEHVTTQKANNLIQMLKYGYDDNRWNEVYEQWRQTADKTYADEMVAKFGLSTEELKKQQVVFEPGCWTIPVHWNGMIVDTREYRPGCNPKVQSTKGAPAGLIIPYDIWRQSPTQFTFICAGEKDMLVARSHGLNAITITGGEMNSNFFNIRDFKDRDVAICYDNDQAGRLGAEQLARKLLGHCKSVRVITAFHNDFPGKDTKEDITDWFCKYGGTAELMKEYVSDTAPYEVEDTNAEPEEITATEAMIYECLGPDQDGQYFKVKAQVNLVSDDAYMVIKEAKFKKVTNEPTGLEQGQEYSFTMVDNPTLVFSLVGVNESRQLSEILEQAGVPNKGLQSKISTYSRCILASIQDIHCNYEQRREMPVLFMDEIPAQGKSYELTILRCHHIRQGYIGGIVTKMVELTDIQDMRELSVPEAMQLAELKHCQGSVEERINDRAQRVRGLLGYEADLDMITAIDLAYNSVESFDLMNTKDVRGYIDMLVVGESRVGKSDTAKILNETYGLGEFISLAGSAATLPGIVGGSARDQLGKMSTRAGALPRNNRGLVVFEELSKAPDEILRSLTDVRSSGKARVVRVSGSIEMPASLRMITLSNARVAEDGTTIPLMNYGSGIDIVQELVGASEDIARYDYISLVGNPERIDPTYACPEPYDINTLRTAIRWAWSRKADDIVWIDGADTACRDWNNTFVNEFPSNIKLMGPEGWKKLGRLAVAAAVYTISTDNEFMKVLVTPEHVEWAYNFIKRLYTNKLFRLDQYSELYVAKTQANTEDLSKLQRWYAKYKNTLDMMYRLKRMSSAQLNTLLGGSDADNRIFISDMICCFFFEVKGREYVITDKFIGAYNRIDKHTVAPSAPCIA